MIHCDEKSGKNSQEWAENITTMVVKVKKSIRGRGRGNRRTVFPLNCLLLASSLIACLVLVSYAARSEDAPGIGKQSERILDKETFEDLYIALLESAEAHRMLADTSRIKFDPSPIFAQFQADVSDFRSTVESYRGVVKRWQEFYKSVVKKLEEKARMQIEKKKTDKPASTGAPAGPS